MYCESASSSWLVVVVLVSKRVYPLTVSALEETPMSASGTLSAKYGQRKYMAYAVPATCKPNTVIRAQSNVSLEKPSTRKTASGGNTTAERTRTNLEA